MVGAGLAIVCQTSLSCAAVCNDWPDCAGSRIWFMDHTVNTLFTDSNLWVKLVAQTWSPAAASHSFPNSEKLVQAATRLRSCWSG